jgi:hypothetical protein
MSEPETTIIHWSDLEVHQSNRKQGGIYTSGLPNEVPNSHLFLLD